MTARLVLGSGSPRRSTILSEIGLPADEIAAADIDETPHKGELPGPYVSRLSRAKNAALAGRFPDDYLITADTTVAVGRRILGKPDDAADATRMLTLLAGRNHRVYTSITVRAPDGRTASRLNDTRLKVKQISAADIAAAVASGEWQGRAGGYSYLGVFSRFIQRITGSASGVLGLPAYETVNLLTGLGYRPSPQTENADAPHSS